MAAKAVDCGLANSRAILNAFVVQTQRISGRILLCLSRAARPEMNRQEIQALPRRFTRYIAPFTTNEQMWLDGPRAAQIELAKPVVHAIPQAFAPRPEIACVSR